MKWWAVKRGMRIYRAFVRNPYTRVEPQPEHTLWHQHICLALRLGPEAYRAFCPYADQKGFEPEGAIQCEMCSNFVILSSVDGKMHIEGEPELFDAYTQDRGENDTEEKNG